MSGAEIVVKTALAAPRYSALETDPFPQNPAMRPFHQGS
jgi:hypothetical protein